jgi:hypothetical protein
MATGIETIIMLTRSILGDLDSTSYSDTRITQVIMSAAFYLSSVATFSEKYTVNVVDLSISPNPVDENFLILCAYKTACMISSYELKNASGIIMRDGPSMIDTKGTAQNMKSGMESICKIFDQLLTAYLLDGGITGGVGQAIIGPYSPGANLIGWNNSDFRGAEWQ